MPNALLVYPEHPPAYWGLNFALEISGLKAANPPLGLITIAAMFPSSYDLRVVDMNVAPLEDSDLEWADLAFISSMIIQRESQRTVIDRCNRAGISVVAGGPYPTSYHQEIDGVDHFVLDEVEETLAGFLSDLENGTAKRMYREARKPDMRLTPVPRFDLIDMTAYHSMSVQFSRGCPFDCEFCDITKLYGRVPRTKTPEQVIGEFDTLYRLGWRSHVFLVDDNFIGNRRDAMELLPVLAEWQKARGYPFSLFTEATVNLARMDKLMDAMVEAGFDSVFLGIETPNPGALMKMKKPQNVSRQDENYLFNSVRRIQHTGMKVSGGFILGVDGEDEHSFDAQIDFIQKAGIPMAIISLLSALKDTNLHARLKSENRLVDDYYIESDGMTINFEPEMDRKTLMAGYRRVVTTIYDPNLENYFKRCRTLLDHLKPVSHLTRTMSEKRLYVAVMSVRRRLSPRQVPAFTKFVADVARARPRMLPEAVRLAALGYHFEKVTRQQIAIRDFKESLSAELESFRESAARSALGEEELGEGCRALLDRADARFRSIPDDFRYLGDGVERAMESFRLAVLGTHAEQPIRLSAR